MTSVTQLGPDDLDCIGTDMTLILGAESHIFRGSGDDKSAFPDPSSEECLRDFVDLLVNAEKAYYTLPKGSTDRGTPILIKALKDLLVEAPEAASSAAPPLVSGTEETLVSGFTRMAKAHGVGWLDQWVRFQMLNPIVTVGHPERMGGKLLLEDTPDVWERNRKRILRTIPKRVRPNVGSQADDYVRESIARFGSEADFMLCYALDVYRRALPYFNTLGKVPGAPTYCPHPLRHEALTTVAPRAPEATSENLKFSWGDYVVRLLADSEYHQYRGSPERVAGLIRRIRAASKDVSGARRKWMDVPNDIQLLNEVAAEAKIEKPIDYDMIGRQARAYIVKQTTEPTPAYDTINAGVGAIALGALRIASRAASSRYGDLATGVAGVMWYLCRPIIVKRLNAWKPEISDWIVDKKRRAANLIHKDAFGYRSPERGATRGDGSPRQEE